jgi:drug/metabolite transporter (DMT)-like permease
VAIKHVTAMEAILIPTLEPILNPLWALLFMGERLGSWALLGGAVVILSIVYRAVMGSRKGVSQA